MMKHQHTELIGKILSSNLLLEEDYEYLLLHSTECEATQKLADPSSKQSSTPISLHLFIAFISVLFGLWNLEYLWIQVLSCGVVAYLIFKVFVIQVKKYKEKTRLRNLISSLDEYIKESHSFKTSVHKCIRFIKESEIAAMGYTLISKNTPTNRFQGARQKIARECLQLRCQVLKSTVDAILSHRNTALEIMSSELTNYELKFNLSLCQIPIEELGPCFDKDKSFEDFMTLTDNFCIEVLCDIVSFMNGQRSEFLKIFSLAAYDIGCDLVSVNHIVKQLSLVCKEESEKLTTLYKLHQKVECAKGHKDMSTLGTGVKTPLFAPVHSMQVHLRAALQVAIESEELMGDSTKLDYLKDHLLPQLKIHLDASNHCVNESMRYVEPQPESAREIAKLTNVRNDDDNRLEVPPDASLLDPREEFSEDQIFEAVADDEKDAESRSVECETDEFGKSRKRRIQETKHVMKELESVLHVKTSAEEREIRKSKLFPNYVPKIFQPDPEIVISKTEHDIDNALNVDISESSETAVGTADKGQSYSLSADGDIEPLHDVLRQPRKIAPPGRITRKAPHRIPQPERWKLEGESNGGDSVGGNPGFDKGDVRLGFGFPSMLASQAVQMALTAKLSHVGDLGSPRIGFGLTGSEAVFGDSDSDS